MTILSLDSSNSNLSATLFQVSPIASFCIEPQNIQKTRNQKSSIYLPQIIKLMKDNKIQLSDIKTLAVISGPGSFTGIRTALSITKTLSYELQIPIFAVNNFELIRFEQDIKDDEPVVLAAGKTGFFISRNSDYKNSEYNFFSHDLPKDLGINLKQFKESNLSLTLSQYCIANKDSKTPKLSNEILPYYLREPSIGKKKH